VNFLLNSVYEVVWYKDWTVNDRETEKIRGETVQYLSVSKSFVDQAYEMLLDAICDGTLKPGDRITQDEIAVRLNVSRQPVMHALAILKSQGFVIEAGRRGLAVVPVDPKLLEAIYQFRSAIEPLAVTLAIPRLTPNKVVHAREIVARGKDMVATGDAKSVLDTDIEFHTFFYELSENPIVNETMKLYWHHIRRSMGEILQYPGLSSRVWQEHEAILEATISGDAAAAAVIMQNHITNAYSRISGQ
jgi:DNA-binding GntR family transcriptional regulator